MLFPELIKVDSLLNSDKYVSLYKLDWSDKDEKWLHLFKQQLISLGVKSEEIRNYFISNNIEELLFLEKYNDYFNVVNRFIPISKGSLKDMKHYKELAISENNRVSPYSSPTLNTPYSVCDSCVEYYFSLIQDSLLMNGHYVNIQFTENDLKTLYFLYLFRFWKGQVPFNFLMKKIKINESDLKDLFINNINNIGFLNKKDIISKYMKEKRKEKVNSLISF